MEFKEFENNGLKIDQERVLTYSKLSCPLDCTYCFVDEMTQEQSKGVAYLNENQIRLLQNLPEQVRLIMLGCDTEFFQNKKEALDILEKLSSFGKDISVITKIPLSEEYLQSIANIAKKIIAHGNVFSFSISLPCFSGKMVEKYEPKVPDPLRRIETLKTAYKLGISTTLAIRPLLPDVSDEELSQIVGMTKDYCFGYYSGPLYLQEQKIKLLLPNYVSKPETEIEPRWMLDRNKYQVIETEGQMDFLKSLVKKNDRLFFEGAAESVEYLRNKNKYEKS
ncbi:MAG: radical SAM protein [Candidatus Nomurabacteria bacterium]